MCYTQSTIYDGNGVGFKGFFEILFIEIKETVGSTEECSDFFSRVSKNFENILLLNNQIFQ